MEKQGPERDSGSSQERERFLLWMGTPCCLRVCTCRGGHLTMTQRRGSWAGPRLRCRKPHNRVSCPPRLGSSERTNAPPAVAPPASRVPHSTIRAFLSYPFILSQPRVPQPSVRPQPSTSLSAIRASFSHPRILSHAHPSTIHTSRPVFSGPLPPGVLGYPAPSALAPSQGVVFSAGAGDGGGASNWFSGRGR